MEKLHLERLTFILLVFNPVKHIHGAQPNLFEDYFDEDVKVVSLPLLDVIEKCVNQPTQLINKMRSSVKGCLGSDSVYNYDDFAKLNQGEDSDKNGLTVKLENGEACFYGEMGWVVGAKVDKAAVIKDFSNLVSESVKKTFIDNINKCSAWNGEFGKGSNRRRRDIVDSDYWKSDYYSNEDKEEGYPDVRDDDGYPDKGDEADGEYPVDGDEGQYPDVLPDSVEDKGGMLSWWMNLVSHRVKRQAPSQKKTGIIKKDSNGGLGKQKIPQKGIKSGQKKIQKNFGNGKKMIPQKKGLMKTGNRKLIGKGGARGGMGIKKKKFGGKKKKFGKKKKKKNVMSKSNQQVGTTRTLKQQVYNQLWCFDLSVEEALRECVKEKLN